MRLFLLSAVFLAALSIGARAQRTQDYPNALLVATIGTTPVTVVPAGAKRTVAIQIMTAGSTIACTDQRGTTPAIGSVGYVASGQYNGLNWLLDGVTTPGPIVCVANQSTAVWGGYE